MHKIAEKVSRQNDSFITLIIANEAPERICYELSRNEQYL